MCRADDSDMPAFVNETKRKARKPHKCHECRRWIQPGERYAHVCGQWDGAFHAFKVCAHCDVLRDWLSAECGGYLFGEVVEDVREHVQEYGVREYGWPLARLAVAASYGWRTKSGTLKPIPARPRTTHDRGVHAHA
jgi:hypothetical protein